MMIADTSSPEPPGTSDAPVMLTSKDLCRILRISKATFYRYKRSGRLPAPVRMGGGRNGAMRWRSSDVYAWIDTLTDDATLADPPSVPADPDTASGKRGRGRPRKHPSLADPGHTTIRSG